VDRLGAHRRLPRVGVEELQRTRLTPGCKPAYSSADQGLAGWQKLSACHSVISAIWPFILNILGDNFEHKK
jgi:hypothetical protein